MKPFQGQQIKPAVDLLMKAFKFKIGDVYQHDEIAHAAGIEYPSHRYRTVIKAWRSMLMREHNIDIQSVHDIGYRVLDDNERVSHGSQDFRRSVKHMGRSTDRIAGADVAKLDETHRRQQDHAVRVGIELVKAGRKASRQIATLGKIESLPRETKEEKK